MRILVAPNSFKGTLTAGEAARAIAEGLSLAYPDAEILEWPMADGGEGTLNVLVHACRGTIEDAPVVDAEGRSIRAHYGRLMGPHGEQRAIIEVAEVIGLARMANPPWPVGWRTTFGVGQLLRHVASLPVDEMMIGLGGSSTNDGGAGLLAALGWRFFDREGHELWPIVAHIDACELLDDDTLARMNVLGPIFLGNLIGQGEPVGTLAEIARVDDVAWQRWRAEKRFRLIVLSDVQNPLCGPAGATAVFGPQKGVPAECVAPLDTTLARLAEVLDRHVGAAISSRPSSGAAGGLGYALQLLGGEIRSGAELVAELSGLDRILPTVDWVITGEGRSDHQTLAGKGPAIVATKARAANRRVSLVSGQIDSSAVHELSGVFDDCYAVSGPGPRPTPARAAALLRAACQTLR